MEVIATWQRGAVHVWGWDGERTMPVGWFAGEFRRPRWPDTPLAIGHVTGLDVVLPEGEHIRPASVRIEPASAPGWLAALGAERRAASDSLGVVRRARRPGRRHRRRRPGHPGRSRRGRVEGRPVGADPRRAHGEGDRGVRRRRPARVPTGDERRGRRDPRRLGRRRSPAAAARRRLAGRAPPPSLPGDGRHAGCDRRPREARSGGPRRGRSPRRSRRRPAGDVRSPRPAPAGGEPIVVPRVRLVVPDDPADEWEVVLELVDELDSGRWCTGDDVWEATPLAVELAGDEAHLAKLAEVLTETAPTRSPSRSTRSATSSTSRSPPASSSTSTRPSRSSSRHRPSSARLGVELIGPERLVKAGVAVRGIATPAPTDDRRGRFGRDAVVEWSLAVVDGDGPAAISAAELARAEAAGATLLRAGHRWVRIDPAALRRARRRLVEHRRDHDHVDAAHAAAAGVGRRGGRRHDRHRRRRTGLGRRPARRPARRPSPRERTSRRRSSASCATTSVAACAWLRFLGRPRPRRVPGRRHGPRQDGDDARPPARPPGATPRRVPAVGRAQLGDGGGPLHADVAGRRPPRRRARAEARRRAHRRRRRGHHVRSARHATSSTWRRSSGRRWCSTRPRR